MRAFLETLLPRFHDRAFKVVAHEGKQDLRRSIPKKLRGWREPGARFVVLHDRDAADCIVLKDELQRLCQEAGRSDAQVRIVCPHLESWVLGDLDAVGEAFGDAKLVRHRSKARYRNPDELANAADELRRLVPSYQKVSGARRVAECLEPDRNASRSFRVFSSTCLRG